MIVRLMSIPQRSVMEPLLFLICSNDLGNYFKNCHTTMFTGDATIRAFGKLLYDLLVNITKTLDIFSSWYKRNRIILNASVSLKLFNTCDKIRTEIIVKFSLLLRLNESYFYSIFPHHCYLITIFQMKALVLQELYSFNTNPHTTLHLSFYVYVNTFLISNIRTVDIARDFKLNNANKVSDFIYIYQTHNNFNFQQKYFHKRTCADQLYIQWSNMASAFTI